MHYQATKDFIKVLEKHDDIMSLWKDQNNIFYIDAKTLLENHKDIRLKDITYEIVKTFDKKMNDLYLAYFKEKCQMTPQEISKVWIEKAKNCNRCTCSGRYWPTDSKNVPTEYYGYDVDIRDQYGYTNLLLKGQYDENSLIVESEINKIVPTDLEKFAFVVAGYRVTIAKNKSRYYDNSY